MAAFVGAGNSDGVRLLLDLGFDVGARADHRGTLGETALHIAVWREHLATVLLLVEHGAPLEALNQRSETPLSLAVRALTEGSEWTPHETTAIVAALLQAGARPQSVSPRPSSSESAEALLRQYESEG